MRGRQQMRSQQVWRVARLAVDEGLAANEGLAADEELAVRLIIVITEGVPCVPIGAQTGIPLKCNDRYMSKK